MKYYIVAALLFCGCSSPCDEGLAKLEECGIERPNRPGGKATDECSAEQECMFECVLRFECADIIKGSDGYQECIYSCYDL